MRAIEINRVHWFTDTRMYYISEMEYYMSKTGQSVAVRLIVKPVDEQRNPPLKSRRVYIPVSQVNNCDTEKNLFNLACWKLQHWLEKAQAYYWKQSIIVKCRAYHATHLQALKDIDNQVFNTYGKDWHESCTARSWIEKALAEIGIRL